MALEQVSTFVLPNEYQRQATEARRRRRMAEMLAQQAYQPSDISAPIPTAAPLVQGLQAFLAARAERKADEAEESAKETASREARQYLKALTEEPDTTTNAVQPETKAAPTITMPQFEDGRITAPTGIEMGAPAPMVAPQIQLSRYNLTPGQRRAAALEGMLASENPMMQRIAGAIYPTLQPEKPRLQLGNIDPAKFTPASIADAMNSGDVSKLQLIAPEGAALTPLSKMLSEREARIARNPNDPNIAILTDAIKKEIAPARGTTVNVTNRYGAPMAVEDAQGNPVLIQPSQTGGPPSVLKGFTPPPSNAKPMTEGESNSATFADRMAISMPELDRAAPTRISAAIAGAPYGLGTGNVSEKDQTFFQAKDDFIAAVLRKESGAAIGANERADAEKQYIPQPGDKPAVLAQKKRAREAAFLGMQRAAGSSYKPKTQALPQSAKDMGVTQQDWNAMTPEQRKLFN